MSTLREYCDPELATLRELIVTIPKPARSGLESARYHLYLALEQSDMGKARHWIRVLRDRLDSPEGAAALDRIEETLQDLAYHHEQAEQAAHSHEGDEDGTADHTNR